jgi:hypothetical protein
MDRKMIKKKGGVFSSWRGRVSGIRVVGLHVYRCFYNNRAGDDIHRYIYIYIFKHIHHSYDTIGPISPPSLCSNAVWAHNAQPRDIYKKKATRPVRILPCTCPYTFLPSPRNSNKGSVHNGGKEMDPLALLIHTKLRQRQKRWHAFRRGKIVK